MDFPWTIDLSVCGIVGLAVRRRGLWICGMQISDIELGSGKWTQVEDIEVWEGVECLEVLARTMGAPFGEEED